jgi:hypothetical protein
MLPLLSFITLPEGAATSTLAYAGDLFTDLWVIIALAIGVPLAFYIIRKIIAVVPKGR